MIDGKLKAAISFRIVGANEIATALEVLVDFAAARPDRAVAVVSGRTAGPDKGVL